MRYTVFWVPGAERELAELWLDESVREAVTNAANQLDQRLQYDPQDQGESRPMGRRIVFESPLAITFKVFPNNHIVRVLEVWRFTKRTGGSQ